jgi:hypothetical protein
VHVAVIDVPAFLAGVSRSAAGEGGHAPLKRVMIGLATTGRLTLQKCRRERPSRTPVN